MQILYRPAVWPVHLCSVALNGTMGTCNYVASDCTQCHRGYWHNSSMPEDKGSSDVAKGCRYTQQHADAAARLVLVHVCGFEGSTVQVATLSSYRERRRNCLVAENNNYEYSTYK
jgi:hypothetical protein